MIIIAKIPKPIETKIFLVAVLLKFFFDKLFQT